MCDSGAVLSTYGVDNMVIGAVLLFYARREAGGSVGWLQ